MFTTYLPHLKIKPAAITKKEKIAEIEKEASMNLTERLKKQLPQHLKNMQITF